MDNWFTYRHYWGLKHGSWKLNLQWSRISSESRVFASITEGELGRQAAHRGDVVRFGFIGDARCTVHNVATDDGGVRIWVTINWPDDIPIFVDYLVVNPST